MPLQIKREDILRIKADAVVNPTDVLFSGSGGTDYQIHKAAGERLKEELYTRNGLNAGEVCVTDSYDMENCRYIIHTVGPQYIDGNNNEAEILSRCYFNALSEARKLNLESIAFPLISSGTYRFPKGEALKIATDTITAFLLDNDMEVSLLVYSKDAFDTAKKLFVDIRDYLDQEKEEISYFKSCCIKDASFEDNQISEFRSRTKKRILSESALKEFSINGTMSFVADESFSEYIRRLLKEKQLEDVDVYKKCNMDRKLFNHIKNDSLYRPKKETAVAVAIGFRLNMSETEKLLNKAGFVLSDSFVFDKIIRYCISNSIYDIYDINEILFQYDQKTLGC